MDKSRKYERPKGHPAAGTTDGKYDRYLLHRFLTLRHAFRLMRSMCSPDGRKFGDSDLNSFLRNGDITACLWLREDDLVIPLSPTTWQKIDAAAVARSRTRKGKLQSDFQISAARPMKRYLGLLENISRAKTLPDLSACDEWALDKLSLESFISSTDLAKVRAAARTQISRIKNVKPRDSFVVGFLVEDWISLRDRRVSPTNLSKRGSPGVSLSDQFWIELVRVLVQSGRPKSQKALLRDLLQYVAVTGLKVQKTTITQRILKVYEALGWQQVRRKSRTKASN
jgi:hypothetical protein